MPMKLPKVFTGHETKAGAGRCLIHQPELIILDEPLTGLDAAAARQVKDLLLAHVAQGGTVILTTHILEVAERMAQRIGIIQHGKLIAEGSLDELRNLTSVNAPGAEPGTHVATLEQVFLQLTEPA